jgi:para-nitrobenzyl esterase
MTLSRHAIAICAVLGCGDDSTGDTGAGCPTSVAARPGTVLTTTGPVTGALAGTVYAWKGIPYAAPPVDDLRWQPPAPAPCWSEERAAAAFGAKCPQLDADGRVVGDEDCLTLNVWAPAAGSSAPVLVFVHGGGNVQGSASDPVYDGAALAAGTGAVVVTFDYRLGALGFFASPALDAEQPQRVSGNYGILDQLAVLAWVQANIAGFGGAADRVLLFGESAGAQDTLIHVASPLSAGLFAAAAVESGGSYRTTLADHEIAMQAVVDAVGCTSAASIATCMRAVPAATLAAIPSAVGPLASGMRYVPSIDGYVLTDTVPHVLAAGGHNHVPLIIGTNADETSRMVPQVTTAEQYEAVVQAMFGAAAATLLALYPASAYPTPQKALIRLTTDVVWTCPIRRLARLASAHQSEPVFRYHFSWTPPGVAGAIVGATHGMELPFVFRTFSAVSASFSPSTEDLALSDAIEGYWSRLAATGDPDGANALAWPRYDSATDPYLELDTPISTGAGLATTSCDAIDAFEM